MSEFDRPNTTLYDEPTRRRAGGSRFGERLARTFGSFDRTQEELPAWEPEGELEYPVEAETEAWNMPDSPFPISRNGYDPAAVDQRIDELERELGQLRAGANPKSAIAAEIERIGEQTASILLVAHEQAQEIKREAQEQADRCLADAASNAVQMTADAKRRLTDLDTEADSVWQERDRLLGDARHVATALFTLVEEALERFPAEGEKGAAHGAPAPPAPAPPRPPIAKAADDSYDDEE